MAEFQGNSESVKKSYETVRKLFEKFVKSLPEGQRNKFCSRWNGTPIPFEELPETVICDREVYTLFKDYLVNTYRTNKGTALQVGVIVNYTRALIRLACNKWKAIGSDKSKLFFTCLDKDASTDERTWLSGLVNNLYRNGYLERTAAGESEDSSAEPLYPMHWSMISRAYSREGSPEAMRRKFTLRVLQSACGRTTEVMWTNWNGFRWDSHFNCLFQCFPQVKTAKDKLVALVAGATRHDCYYTALGDFLATCVLPVLDDEEPPWVFPELHLTESPGSKLGGYIKAVVPATKGGSGVKQFSGYTDEELPANINASGIRAGACNALFGKMPAEYVVQVSGHDLRHVGALFEYVDTTRASLMPGATVLAGWEPFPWGHNGMGPKPASLKPLQDAGIDIESVYGVMDEVFSFDSTTPQILAAKGSLRPAIEAAFASLLMYYCERVNSNEAGAVIRRMNDAFVNVLQRKDVSDELPRWATLIRNKFLLDNHHLTSPPVHGQSAGDQKVCEALRNLGYTVSSLHKSMTAMQSRISDLASMVHDHGVSLSHPTPGTSARPPQPFTSTAIGVSLDRDTIPNASDALSCDAHPGKKPEPMLKRNMGCLKPPTEKDLRSGGRLQDMSAESAYLQYKCGTLQSLEKQDLLKVKNLVKSLDALATPEELRLVSDRNGEHGTRRKVFVDLLDGFFKCVQQCYTSKGVKVPKNHSHAALTKKSKTLYTPGMFDHLLSALKLNFGTTIAEEIQKLKSSPHTTDDGKNSCGGMATLASSAKRMASPGQQSPRPKGKSKQQRRAPSSPGTSHRGDEDPAREGFLRRFLWSVPTVRSQVNRS